MSNDDDHLQQHYLQEHTAVHSRVHAQIHIAEPTVGGSSAFRKRPKVRHLTLSGDSWLYQRKYPRTFSQRQHNLSLRKRIGVLSVLCARRVAASIDRLVDGLIYSASERRWQMSELDDLAGSIDPVTLAYMLEKMDQAFHQSVSRLIDSGFEDPSRESRIIIACLEKFRADLSAFDTGPFGQEPDGQRFSQSRRLEAHQSIGDYDCSLNSAELNMRGLQGRSFEELADALSQTSTGSEVIAAGMAAFMESVFGSPEFADFEARSKAETAVRNAFGAYVKTTRRGYPSRSE